MLGLGDVVLPGIMMALALRFDLYLHYLRLAKPDKVAYVEATGTWGDRFWTRKGRQPLDTEITTADGGRFRKVYFTSSVVGYIIGMLCTLVVLNVYNHAQPALLYLVPGVLISVWGTAAVRGEWSLMWNYTEDGSLETVEAGKNVKDVEKTEEELAEEVKEKARRAERAAEHAHHVVLFSISEPRGNTVVKKARFLEDVKVVGGEGGLKADSMSVGGKEKDAA